VDKCPSHINFISYFLQIMTPEEEVVTPAVEETVEEAVAEEVAEETAEEVAIEEVAE
jgi:hypothetical protein